MAVNVLSSKYQIIKKVECPFLDLELAETSAEFHVGNRVEIQVFSRGA